MMQHFRYPLPCAILIAILTVLSGSLSACGSGGSASSEADTVTDPAPEAGDEPGTNPGSAPAPPDETPARGAMPLLRSGFEAGVELSQAAEAENPTRAIVGTDIPGFKWQSPLFGEADTERADVLCVTGRGLPEPAENYCLSELTEVTGRGSSASRVLAMRNVSESPSTGVQQIILRRYGMTREPVIYQRMWIKFDAETLRRASAIGAQDFYQIFWEMKAEPDYRIRIQLQLDASGRLFWETQGDRLRNSNPLWLAQLHTVPVVLAGPDSSAGWHKVEVWMDRPGERFRAAIDGVTMIDRNGNLTGDSQNIVSQIMMAIVYSDVAPLASMFVDDLEIFGSPPADAWQP